MSEARTNREWLSSLQDAGRRREEALADLRSLLEEGLPYALRNYLSPTDPGFDPLIQETVQETLLRVLDHLETFRGESRFTTWANKIAVRLALSELRRKRWEDVSIGDLVGQTDALVLERIESDQPGPEELVERRNLMDLVNHYIQEELTERQRKALMAVGVKGMPTAEAARQLGTNRNALYKVLHDARLKLKGRLAQDGLDPEELLGVFER